MSIEVVIITTILTIVGGILAISNNFLNLRDRLKKKEKKSKIKQVIDLPTKDDYIIDNTSFKFNLSFVSNSPPGICKLTSSFVNLSGETKFIEPISYNFEIQENKQQYEPSCLIMNNENWPKRLEHGQRFYISVDFQHILHNNIFRYWKKNVLVNATCNSSTGDYLRSNNIKFDELIKCLIPLKEEYSHLAKELASKGKGSIRDLEAILWQLQIFDRVTSHVVQQLEQNQIPILKFLNLNYGLILNGTDWPRFQRNLESKKVAPSVMIKFLNILINN